METPFYSVILPLYKQELQVEMLIRDYTAALNNIGESWELLLVINGKKDNAYELARAVGANSPNIRIYDLEKGGWGHAVKFGLSEARGKYICFTNSARTNIADLILLLNYGKVNDHVVVKATRIVRESFLRRFGSTLYNFENRMLFRTPVWDVNGTPKVLPSKVLEKLTIESEDDLIDAEIMAKCFRAQIPIIEIPVVHTQRISGVSTTNLFSAFKMYFGLIALRKRI
jgi:glycosyltransferase involved in cell wall biosynthesis